LYLTPTNKYWALDIEGDLIPSTKIWCIVAVNIITGEEFQSAAYEEIRDWINERVSEGCKFIGHNIIGYDAPTLNRLLGTKLTMGDIIDTLVMSMLYSPSLDGGHSLAAWGTRLRSPKLEFEDFSEFTPEMLVYCRQDTLLCRLVYRDLVRRMTGASFTDLGLEIEHRSWQLIKKQQENGFFFDIREAHALYSKLRQEENAIRDRVYEIWPPTIERVGVYKQARKKDGSYTKGYLAHCEQYERVSETEGGGYEAYDYVAFNIGSPMQRIEKLLELGWECLPDERTPTGQPKPTSKGQLVPSLQEFVESSGLEGPRLIAHWLEYNARANMINTWIEAYNEKTSCIHGSLWLANTLRYRHSNPNTANIPAVRLETLDKGLPSEREVPLLKERGVYTYEARDLWGTRNRRDRRLVGVDAKGIQLRVLAHYLNNKDFTDAVLGGDPHSYNQKIGGFASRPIAKTFIYAFLLGAGDAKVGQIIGGSTRDGRDIKKRFIGNFPGLAELLNKLEREIEKTGRIRLIDGTPILVTAPHTRLGYLLQGDESRIMKKAMIDVARQVQREHLDVLKVGDIHDEWQSDVLFPDVSPYVSICERTFPEVGRFFNYNIPLACDAKIGLTWAETH